MINTTQKDDGAYFNFLRHELLKHIVGKPLKVLEIGCASGLLLAHLKKSHGIEFAVGIELAPEVANVARERPEIDIVISGNIEEMSLDFNEQSFDLILAGHVLEHLVDPWATMTRLSRYLRKGGQFIGAVPNLRHISVCAPLVLRGTWRYQPSGIMDWTHMRFFTRQTILEMLETAGYEKCIVTPEFWPRAQKADTFTLHRFSNLLAYSYSFSGILDGRSHT